MTDEDHELPELDDEDTPGIGHNSVVKVDQSAKEQLRAFVERIERLNEEKDALASDIREVFAEAKAMGHDVKCLRTVIRLRKMDKAEREEQAAVTELYMRALGMVD